MLKMTVSPLDNRNNSIPNRTPLSVEMTINSAKAHSLKTRTIDVNRKLRTDRTPASPPDEGGPPRPCSREGASQTVDQGRFILQVVGTIACAVSILETRCQPQPVFSSSNGSFALSASVPNEEM